MDNDEFFCNVTDRGVTNTGVNPFSNKNYIKRSHNLIPRMGNPSDVAVLVTGTSEEAGDYLVGMVTASIWIFSIFLCWMITLIVLTGLGSKNVSVFSGRRVRRPRPPRPPPSSQGEAVEVEMNEPSDEDDALSVSEIDNLKDDKVKEGALLSEEGEKDEQPSVNNNDVRYPVKIHDGQSDDEGIDEEYAAALEEWQTNVERNERFLRRIRITVLVSGLVIVVAVIVMIVAGVKSLHNSVENVQAGLQEAERLSLEAVALIDNTVFKQETAANQTTSLREELNAFCPGVRRRICESLSPLRNCSYSFLPEFLVEPLQTILESGRRYVYSELLPIRGDLVDVARLAEEYQGVAGGFNWAFYVAGGWAVLVGILTLILMYGVVLAWRGKLHDNCCDWIGSFVRNWFIVPVYAFFVVMSWIFSMVFVIGAVLAADTCVDSPDSRISSYLHQYEDQFSSIVYDFVLFYVEGCPAEGLPRDLDAAAARVVELLDAVSTFGARITNVSSDVIEVCERDPSDYELLGNALQQASCAVANSLQDVREYFSCENFRPVYESVVYGAFCYEGTQGFVVLTLTQIVIVFFSMIMLTLRVAFAEVKEEEDEETRRRCIAWCRKTAACGKTREHENEGTCEEKNNGE